MSYAVKTIFATVQGEGANMGRAAVFVRFSGCNLWSGREEDRDKGPGSCSRWCDTDFLGTNGGGGGRYESAQALLAAVLDVAGPATSLVVLTGGEPALQIDGPLIAALQSQFEVAVETNGTVRLKARPDWVCVSPKAGSSVLPSELAACNEVKVVWPQQDYAAYSLGGLLSHAKSATHYWLSPRDDGDADRNAENLAACIEQVQRDPRWRLGIQAHKHWGLA